MLSFESGQAMDFAKHYVGSISTRIPLRRPNSRRLVLIYLVHNVDMFETIMLYDISGRNGKMILKAMVDIFADNTL